MVLAVGVHVLELVKLARSKMTWCEGRPFVHRLVLAFFNFMVDALHGLKVVPSTKETFNLRVIVIVVYRLHKIRMLTFELSVMELIRKTAMSSM